ncbi:MAG: hypothetical protein WCL08_10010 [Verrucomicrobiota bacterium]
MSAPNEAVDILRVGPGTAMGGLMRQYWIPAAMSKELQADGAPMRLMLLGALNWAPNWYRADGAASPRTLARHFIAMLKPHE